MTDWYARCAYDPEVKQRFHTAARARLRRLATTLRFPLGSFDLRSNLGGIAVSGEITLHHDDVYIQVCQPASGADSGILIRTCQDRRDYTGGRNHLAPLRLLGPRAALVAVDARAAALAEAGDLVAALNAGLLRPDAFVELGSVEPDWAQRRDPAAITVFKSVGLAIQDLATAGLVATRLGL